MKKINVNQKKKSFLAVLLLTSTAILIGVSATIDKKPSLVLSEENKYSMILDDTNRLVDIEDSYTSGTSNIKTVLGADIAFSYSNIKCYPDGWQTLGADGYIANEGVINGLKKITIETNTTEDIYLNYGYKVDGVIDTSFNVAILNEENGYSFNFLENPSYLKISNNSDNDIHINNINISYTCIVSDNPSWLSLTYTKVSGGYEVSGTNEEDLTKVVIPDTYKGYPVISVGRNAFKDNTNIKEVSIGNNVTTLNAYCFSGTSLTSITLPDSVTTLNGSVFINTPLETFIAGSGLKSIGGDCFMYCYSLSDVQLNEGLTTIGEYAFDNCTSLKEIVIPNTVTTIGSYGFRGCTSLTDITLSNSLTAINNYTFGYCTSLENIEMGDQITSIRSYAFSNCYSLKEFTFPRGITVLSNSIFDYSYSSYVSDVDFTLYIPSTLTFITSKIFYWSSQSYFKSLNVYVEHTSKPSGYSSWLDETCANTTITYGQLGPTTEESNFTFAKINGGVKVMSYTGSDTSVTIPETLGGLPVIEVASYFTSTSKIKNLVLPNTLLKINTYAFFNISSIKNLYIPSSVTAFGSGIAYHAYDVSLFMGHSAKGESWPNDWVDSSMKIYWGAEGIGATSGDYNYYPIEGGACITKYSGSNSDTLTIPSTIDGYDVLELAFTSTYGWKFTSLVIPDTVSKIHERCFAYSGLVNVTIGSGLKTIGKSAFYGCSSLTTVTINSPSFTVDYGAFRSNKALKTFNTVAGSMNIIGTYAFEFCSVLSSDLVLSDKMTTLPSSTFSYCTSLKSVTLGNNVTSIGDYAFQGCSALEYTNIPDGVTKLGFNAYTDVDNLGAIFIPSSVTTIYNSTFSISSSSSGLNIFVEVSSKPSGWASYWHSSDNITVYWDDPGTNIFKPW